MRRISVAIAAFTVLVVAAPAASAAEITTGPAGSDTGFAPSVVVIAPGETVTYWNFDALIVGHNIAASDAFHSKKAARKVKWCSSYPKGKCPLFWSDSVYPWPPNNSTKVLGMGFVKSGTEYGFICRAHPSMKGTFLVR